MWPARATPVAHRVGHTADTGGVDALLRRPLLALLAGALPALLLVALTSGALPAAAVAAGHGANAPIPYQLLPLDNPWNTRVDALPLDPNSADYIADREPLELAPDKTFVLAHTWLDEGTYRAPAAVTGDLARTAGASVAVHVVNLAPGVRAGGTANVAGGALLTRLGAFADPGADTWTGAVDWGDGTARTALPLRADKTFTLTHRFPRARGRGYTVVVTVRDDDGGNGSARFRVTVR